MLYNSHMETPHHNEHEPQEESGREMAQRVLGEHLHNLHFTETDLMAELRAVINEAIADDEPFVALNAYARYQELGEEAAEASGDPLARLALNIACAQLLAVRGERDRCITAIEDCIMHANALGQTDLAHQLDDFLNN